MTTNRMAARRTKDEDKNDISTRISLFEQIDHKAKRMTNPGKSDIRKETPSKCRQFLESRYISLMLGPLIGLFLYYYLTFLVLNGPPFTKQIANPLTVTDNETTTGKGQE